MKKTTIILLSAIAVTAAFAASAKKSTSRGFPLHNTMSAPEASKPIAEGYQQKLKMVPHIIGMMAESPALLLSYRNTQDNLAEMGKLTPAQNNIVQMAISRDNECFY